MYAMLQPSARTVVDESDKIEACNFEFFLPSSELLVLVLPPAKCAFQSAQFTINEFELVRLLHWNPVLDCCIGMLYWTPVVLDFCCTGLGGVGLMDKKTSFHSRQREVGGHFLLSIPIGYSPKISIENRKSISHLKKSHIFYQ